MTEPARELVHVDGPLVDTRDISKQSERSKTPAASLPSSAATLLPIPPPTFSAPCKVSCIATLPVKFLGGIAFLAYDEGGIDNFSPFSNAVYFFNQKLKNVLF